MSLPHTVLQSSVCWSMLGRVVTYVAWGEDLFISSFGDLTILEFLDYVLHSFIL